MKAPSWSVAEWLNTDQAWRLEELQGQVVVLHAFQMLCPACVHHGVPQAERLHRLLLNQNAMVIGLHTVFEHHDVMTPQALRAFLHENRITHPIAIDTPSQHNPMPITMRAYYMQGTPTLVVIDKTGDIRLHQLGQVDDIQLGLLVGELLAE